MATFAPKIIVSLDISGELVTLTDQSNYSDGNPVTINNVQSRTVLVKTGLGATLTTVTFPSGQATATFNITTDHELVMTLTWVLQDSTPVTATQTSLTENIFYNGLINVSKGDCGCGCGNSDLDSMKGVASSILAGFYHTYGFVANAETLINAANILVQN